MLHKIKALAQMIHLEIVSMRRHLHAYPELSFQEFQTAAWIKQQLDGMGIPWTAVAGTGVMATLQGKAGGRVIALRADMDALPIQEQNQMDYASHNAGVMHACGHDFHTASLLGSARILQELSKEWSGTIKLFFQPGEEVLPGGASLMIRDGVLDNPKPLSVLGQHAMPRIPVGMIGLRSGKHMASMDAIRLRVLGRGGHGAQPHQNIDPVVIAAHLIIAMQQLVSRMADPKNPTVLSFGRVIANGAVNVIPDEVLIEGTFRAMDENWRSDAHERIIKMATGLAESMGARCEIEIIRGYPFLINDAQLTARVHTYATEYVGSQNVLDEDVWMAAEDFAYYSQAAPSTFYLFGVGNTSKGIQSSLHTPTFNIDEDALAISTGLMAWMAVRELEG